MAIKSHRMPPGRTAARTLTVRVEYAPEAPSQPVTIRTGTVKARLGDSSDRTTKVRLAVLADGSSPRPLNLRLLSAAARQRVYHLADARRLRAAGRDLEAVTPG